jgi:hypothetical protein
VLFFSCASFVSAAMPAEPPFKLNRYDEDYSFMRDVELQGGEPSLKYLPLGSNGYLSFGGEIRERYDVIDAPRYGIGTKDDSFLLQRVLVHMDLHLPMLRLFVQLGREDVVGKNTAAGASDVDRGDVANAFVDIKPDEASFWTLRAGRQDLFLNSVQRFVSVREGPNVRQSFDGAHLTWADGPDRIDAFATRPVAYKPGPLDDSSDRTQSFSGIYGSRAMGPGQTLDAYVLLSGRDGVRFGSQAGDERRQTFGLHWTRSIGSFDLDAEGAYQTGRFGGRVISAWAASGIVGYTFGHAWKPRLGLDVDVGSGDKGDGVLRTFNPLFPKGAYFNESSTVSWANLVAVRPSIGIQPWTNVQVTASVLGRWRQSGRDAVYTQPYVAIASTLANTSRHVGETYQFDANWKADRNLTLTLQTLHATAGAAVRQAGGTPMNFVMVIGQYRF